MMTSSYCGFGDMNDPNHMEICLMCQKGKWREQHRGLAELGDVLTVLTFMFIFGFVVYYLTTCGGHGG